MAAFPHGAVDDRGLRAEVSGRHRLMEPRRRLRRARRDRSASARPGTVRRRCRCSTSRRTQGRRRRRPRCCGGPLLPGRFRAGAAAEDVARAQPRDERGRRRGRRGRREDVDLRLRRDPAGAPPRVDELDRAARFVQIRLRRDTHARLPRRAALFKIPRSVLRMRHRVLFT